jgi:hypothetical protein
VLHSVGAIKAWSVVFLANKDIIEATICAIASRDVLHLKLKILTKSESQKKVANFLIVVTNLSPLVYLATLDKNDMS